MVSVVTLALLAPGAAPSDVAGVSPPPGILAPSRGNVPLIGGTSSDVLGTLASRFSDIANPQVVTRLVPNEDGVGVGQTVLALTYDLSVPNASGPQAAEAIWEGNLFTGAVVDEFATRGFGDIKEALATLVTPDGQRQLIGGGVANLVRDQAFDAVTPSAEAAISAAATSLGLQNVSVSVQHALQDALVIDATAADSTTLKRVADAGDLNALLPSGPARFEGVLFEIRDQTQHLIRVTGLAPRDGATTFWQEPTG